jgi:hypothetical protein
LVGGVLQCNFLLGFGWQHCMTKRDGELELELGFDDVLSFGLLVLCMHLTKTVWKWLGWKMGM